MEKTRRVARVKNRLSQEIEDAILEYSLHHPTLGQKRVANELNRKHNWKISDGGIRSVWSRHGLEIKSLRLKRQEKWAVENHGLHTESQIKAMEEQKKRRKHTVKLKLTILAFLFHKTLIM